MENRHVAQALQEMLAEFPLADREEWILLFNEKVEALDAAERDRCADNAEDEKRADSDVPEGWEGIAGYETDGGPGHGMEDGQGAEPAASKGKSFPPAAVIGLAALALIEAIIIVVLLVSGGGKSDGPAEPDGAVTASDASYSESAETAQVSKDILASQAVSEQQPDADTPSGADVETPDTEVPVTPKQQTDPQGQEAPEQQTGPEAQETPDQQMAPETQTGPGTQIDPETQADQADIAQQEWGGQSARVSGAQMRSKFVRG